MKQSPNEFDVAHARLTSNARAEVHMPEVLFIGGPKDGHRLVLRELRPWFTVIESIHPSTSDCHLRESLTFKTVEYLLMPFSGESKRYNAYVVQGMSADAALAALIGGYHPGKEAVADALHR